MFKSTEDTSLPRHVFIPDFHLNPAYRETFAPFQGALMSENTMVAVLEASQLTVAKRFQLGDALGRDFVEFWVSDLVGNSVAFIKMFIAAEELKPQINPDPKIVRKATFRPSNHAYQSSALRTLKNQPMSEAEFLDMIRSFNYVVQNKRQFVTAFGEEDIISYEVFNGEIKLGVVELELELNQAPAA